MIGLDQLLRAYLRFVRHASGARVASLYLPAPIGSFPRPLLLHEGQLPAVPELADARAAEEFWHRVESAPGSPVANHLESGIEDGWLLRLPTLDRLLASTLEEQAELSPRHQGRRRGDASESAPAAAAAAWLGLGFDPQTRARPRWHEVLQRLVSCDWSGEADETWAWLLSMGSVLSWHNQHVSTLLCEPVTQLPGRTALNAALKDMIERSGPTDSRVALLLINPDEFAFVNERFGREAGDTVIREIAARLRTSLRRSDFFCRYGGAVFGVALADAGESELTTVAGKLHGSLTDVGYMEGSLRLGMSFGAVCHEAAAGEDSTEAALQLIRRADQALNASKLAGGGRITIWRRDSELEQAGQFDRLSGIFTANQAKDYRNMLLLWDTVRAVASSDDVERLVGVVLERMGSAFHPERATLFERVDEDEYRALHVVDRGKGRSGEEACAVVGAVRKLLDRSVHEARVVEGTLADGESSESRLGCAVPLLSRDRCLGALLLEGEERVLELDSSDHILLGALGGQLAIALDRARLAEQERLRLESEQRVLRRELKELRQVLGESKLVYRSPAMDGVLDLLRRVAPTDATVLICGESGTGKELIARSLYGLSGRRNRPLIVVDCSAIATTLIDSELFGHAKGAYTGAERRTSGRLAEADGGTILLDEIGELPLEVQGKLLRFVQEKQFTPVGSTRPRSVDVRVIAATNRDLPTEVAAGRFRQDLYYRLMVVEIDLPPLRDRPEDVLLLAQHFIERFALQYQKGPRRLTPEAETVLRNREWPGNVRELQNSILQAVILSRREEIGPADLGREDRVARSPRVPAETLRQPATPDELQETGWDALTRVLCARIDATLDTGAAVPLGKWVADDLVLSAYRAASEVHSKAALLVGVPETTFRRRYHKAASAESSGLAGRPADWSEVRTRLAGVLAAGERSSEDLLDRVRRLLLEHVLRLEVSDNQGAQLMGVTPRTYKRWAEETACPVLAG